MENCEKMLANEEAVMVFPEGAKGISKPSSKKYQLQRFGTGFMHLAKKHHAPIIPVGIAGCEEIMYNFGNIDFLEKLLRWPAFPLLLPIVFPSKVVINIGKPMYFDSNIERESDLYHEVDVVKEEIHRLMMEALEIRNGGKKE
jgi:1-acyl-sn-glycerol-3-phosphate acyltransferase